MNKINSQKLLALIKKAGRVLTVIHPSPDLDAVAASAAMNGFLQELNKNYLAYSYDEVPASYQLPWSDVIVTEVIGYDPDLVIILDFSDQQRLATDPALAELTSQAKQVVVIDHHPDQTIRADSNFVDTTKSSTCELLFNFFTHINYKLTPSLATILLAGIFSDTGLMTNRAARLNTWQAVAVLLRLGGSLSRATGWLKITSLSELKLMGLVFTRLKYNQTFNILTTVEKKSDKEKLALANSAGADISNQLKQVGLGHAVLVLKEKNESSLTGSLRSLSAGIDVARLAHWLGGGGHTQAAGFRIAGQLYKGTAGWRVV